MSSASHRLRPSTTERRNIQYQYSYGAHEGRPGIHALRFFPYRTVMPFTREPPKWGQNAPYLHPSWRAPTPDSYGRMRQRMSQTSGFGTHLLGRFTSLAREAHRLQALIDNSSLQGTRGVCRDPDTRPAHGLRCSAVARSLDIPC